MTSNVLQWDKGMANGEFETVYNGREKQYKCNVQNFPPKTRFGFRVKAVNQIGER